MNWEWFTGFISGGKYRAELPGDRISAWIDPPEVEGWEYRWSIEDNSCMKTLDHGYADDLESAKWAARVAAKALELI